MTVNYDIQTRVAAVQSEPIWFDGDATVDKACTIIQEAAENGAEIIGFPELYVSGYPWWLWCGSPLWGSRFYKKYYASSMSLDSDRMGRIRATARKCNIHVVMGYSELAGSSLYMSQAFIGNKGEILANRRKLKPSQAERSLFGEGDGSDLFVVQTPIGRIGGLNCWEHYQPLQIFTMTMLHEQIHVASWPSHDVYQDLGYDYGATIEPNRNVTSVYAQMTQSFVIASTTLIGPSAHEAWELDAAQRRVLPCGGGWAAIFGPDGDELTRDDRIAPDAEGILYADIDLTDLLKAKVSRDPSGHYSRPDIFTLNVNSRRNSIIEFTGSRRNGADESRIASELTSSMVVGTDESKSFDPSVHPIVLPTTAPSSGEQDAASVIRPPAVIVPDSQACVRQ